MFRVLIYRYKSLLSEKVIIFWTLIFPIILATLFSFAFQNLNRLNTIETIPVAVVKTETNDYLLEVMSKIKQGDTHLFDIKVVSSKEEGLKLIDNSEVDGMIDDENVVLQDNGFNQTIITNFMSQFLQKSSMVETLNKMQIPVDVNKLTLNQNWIKQMPMFTESGKIMTVSFYTVIAMACLFGAELGLIRGSFVQANQSIQGARLLVSPYSKWKIILLDIFCSWSLLFIELCIILAYLIFALNITFGSIPLVLLVCFIGSGLAITIGYALSVLIKLPFSVKTALVTTITMVWSFLSGMMAVSVKYFIDANIPILNYINPNAMITDSFYRLYYYGSFDSISKNILIMTGYMVILAIITFIALRRNQYDSI